ncbi:unnamed protein product [Haemonchus placei]|uniref:AAA_12 domain-containing protein n=1 Tax=Haemonchus placei TaxID=6290 RepID=A0A0N4W146_HAEPC|nr:unnamed protein product [Haemonchus placei]
MSSRRESTDEVDNGCVAAESTNILSEVSTEEVSAMDTSEPVPEAQGSSSQDKDTVSSQNQKPPVLQVRWGAPVSLQSCSRRSPTPSSQSSSSTVEQPAGKAQPQQPSKSSLANMTASLEQLAVAHLSPPHPMEVKEERDHSPAPPPKLRRSGSSRRQPVRADAPSSSRGSARGAPPSRGAPSSRPPASGSSRARPATSRPPTRGTASRGRGAPRAPPAAQPVAPPAAPVVLAGSLPQVGTSQLPRETPESFTHPWINNHPWAQFVNPRPLHHLHLNPPTVTTDLDVNLYRHLPDSGYLSKRFNKSLFPQVVFRENKLPASIPFIELPHLDDTVRFREQSQQVIDQMMAGTYQEVDVAFLHADLNRPHQYITKPRTFNSIHPVLYQVVSTGYGSGLVLEAKDFFIMGPDRRDLHCILLDRFGIDIEAGCRGFNRSLVSVKDFVWVYDVKPTPQAFESPEDTLKKASIPRTTALETTASFFFRAAHNAFVTVTNRPDPVYGIILSLTTRNNHVTQTRAVFEGSPDAVTVTPALCNFNLRRLHQYDIVGAYSRVNVSSAMRFCEPPACWKRETTWRPPSVGSSRCTRKKGYSPLESSCCRTVIANGALIDSSASITSIETLWDPNGSSAAFPTQPAQAAGDDRRTHLREVTLVYPLWHPIRIQFSLTDMASEAGWAPGRHVVLWVVGSPSLVWAKVVTLVNFSDRKLLNLTLEAFPWANTAFLRAIRQNGRDSDGSRVFDACIRLSRPNVAANPIYDLVSRLDIFAGLNPYSMGDQAPAVARGFGGLPSFQTVSFPS